MGLIECLREEVFLPLWPLMGTGGSEDLSDDSNEPPEIYKQKGSYQAVERGTVYLSMLKYTVPLFISYVLTQRR